MKFFKLTIFLLFIFSYTSFTSCFGFLKNRMVFNSLNFISRNLFGFCHTFLLNPVFLYSKEKFIKKNKNDVMYDNLFKVFNILSRTVNFKISDGFKQEKAVKFFSDISGEVLNEKKDSNQLNGNSINSYKIRIISIFVLGFFIRGCSIKFIAKKFSNKILGINFIENFNNKIIDKIVNFKFLNKINIFNDFIKKNIFGLERSFLNFIIKRGLNFLILKILSSINKELESDANKNIEFKAYYNSKLADCGFSTFKITNLILKVI
jgi:hypothetical protein